MCRWVKLTKFTGKNTKDYQADKGHQFCKRKAGLGDAAFKSIHTLSINQALPTNLSSKRIGSEDYTREVRASNNLLTLALPSAKELPSIISA